MLSNMNLNELPDMSACTIDKYMKRKITMAILPTMLLPYDKVTKA